jgi:hypothetical protein
MTHEQYSVLCALVVKAGGRVEIEDWRLMDDFTLKQYRDDTKGVLVLEASQVERKARHEFPDEFPAGDNVRPVEREG